MYLWGLTMNYRKSGHLLSHSDRNSRRGYCHGQTGIPDVLPIFSSVCRHIHIHRDGAACYAQPLFTMTTPCCAVSTHMFPEGPRERVAGVFIKKNKKRFPLHKSVTLAKCISATGLRRDLVMGNLSRSLSGSPNVPASPVLFFTVVACFHQFFAFIKNFAQMGLIAISRFCRNLFNNAALLKISIRGSGTFLFFLSGDNRDTGFSDMGPVPSLISHKTAKNGIPAVRTIISDRGRWQDPLLPVTGNAVIFSSM